EILFKVETITNIFTALCEWEMFGFGLVVNAIQPLEKYGITTIESLDKILLILMKREYLFVGFEEWFKLFGLGEKHLAFLAYGYIYSKILFSPEKVAPGTTQFEPIEDVHEDSFEERSGDSPKDRSRSFDNSKHELSENEKDFLLKRLQNKHPLSIFFIKTGIILRKDQDNEAIENVWPSRCENGIAEMSWGYSRCFVSPHVFNYIGSYLIVRSLKIPWIGETTNVYEIEGNMNTLMLKMDWSPTRLTMKARYSASTAKLCLWAIGIITEIKGMIQTIIGDLPVIPPIAEVVLCPKCLEDNHAEVAELSASFFVDQLSSFEDSIEFISNGEEETERHVVPVWSVAIDLQCKKLLDMFSTYAIDSSLPKIKKNTFSASNYAMYEAIYENEPFSMKIFNCDSKNNGRDVAGGLGEVILMTMRECYVANSYANQNLVLIKHFGISNLALLVQPCETTLSLYVHNMENVTLDWKTIIDFLTSICKGMSYAHKNLIIHRNLSTSTIVICTVNGVKTAMVADFGMSILKNKQTLFPFEGCDPAYTAPEVLAEKECKQESDVYSFGIIMWELAHRQKPYEKLKQPIKNAIINGARPTNNAKVPLQEYNKNMTKCWNQQPSCRPSFDSLTKEMEKMAVELTKKK
ncbi:serine-threonine protein kinase, partial [Entamoeba invadens IP1]|uniref:serine-threonine protein kinase n=1 Tax=Entamoeba invadens IP1 TaxID=370355 RepID=UPI0002C3EB7A